MTEKEQSFRSYKFMENTRDSWKKKKKKTRQQAQNRVAKPHVTNLRLALISFSFPRKEKAANQKLPDQY